MTIHLPHELDGGIYAAVHSGRFASVDDAMAEAARLLREIGQRQTPTTPPAGVGTSALDPILGLMRDDAEHMDEIVADVYRQRRDEAWREIDL